MARGRRSLGYIIPSPGGIAFFTTLGSRAFEMARSNPQPPRNGIDNPASSNNTPTTPDQPHIDATPTQATSKADISRDGTDAPTASGRYSADPALRTTILPGSGSPKRSRDASNNARESSLEEGAEFTASGTERHAKRSKSSDNYIQLPIRT